MKAEKCQLINRVIKIARSAIVASLSCISVLSYGQHKSVIYLELLGNGRFYSVNYDTRFLADRNTGWGARIGVSMYTIPETEYVITMPLLINYMRGNNGHYLEAGFGTVFKAVVDNTFFNVGGTISLGYRWQPPDKKILLKVNWTPILSSDLFAPYWGGMSIGWQLN
ncbi:MAG: hypothetical protein V3V00_00560 [Saprospiraceae bacterium]